MTTLDCVRAEKFVHEITGAPVGDISIPVIDTPHAHHTKKESTPCLTRQGRCTLLVRVCSHHYTVGGARA